MFTLSFFISFVCLVIILLIPASFLVTIQHQFTHSPIKNSTLPLRKIPSFQGVAHRQTNCILSCVIPLWDSATAHSPFGEELNPSSQEDVRFSGRCTSAYNFHFIPRHHYLGISNSSLTI